MLDICVGAFVGLAVGFIGYLLSLFQIKQRTQDKQKIRQMKKPLIVILWVLISAGLFALCIWRIPNSWSLRIECALVIVLAMAIATVDISIRKIPNGSLLGILIIRTGYIVYSLSAHGFDNQKSLLISSLAGLAIGFLLFMIPSLIGIPIGAGDTKFCAVIGFTLGVSGYLQAMIIMAAAMLVYLLILKITKKGNLKTATAVGPYLAAGTIVTLLFPFISLGINI